MQFNLTLSQVFMRSVLRVIDQGLRIEEATTMNKNFIFLLNHDIRQYQNGNLINNTCN